jgi:gamma-glutamyltranspeptidase / glutathione hydrolase
LNVQAGTDAARSEHDQESNVLDIESNLDELVGPQLEAMGHTMRSVNGDGMGGLQLVQFTPAPGARAPKGNSIKGIRRSTVSTAPDRICARTVRRSAGKSRPP